MTHKSIWAYENGTCDCAECRAPKVDTRKQAIIDALRAFIEQRPGFEFANYGSMAAYRQDQRRAQRQLHDARELLRAVEDNSEIGADDLLEAAEGGRLSIRHHKDRPPQDGVRIDYCTGQYFPVEFRAGVCRVLSSALWDWQREHMPPAFAPPCCVNKDQYAFRKPDGLIYPMSAGDWLRATFRQRFGKGLQSRWFD